MTTSTKVKSFVKQFVATVTGDNADAQAQKVLRQADSALKSQIPSLEGDLIGLEDALETAKEKLALAKINNGKSIEDRSTYIYNLLQSQNNGTSTEEALELHKKKIAFLKGILTSLDEEVDA
jgi:hypothetical protein